MEQRSSTLTNPFMLIVQASSVLVLASLAFARVGNLQETFVAKGQVLRVDMAHVDSRMDETSVRSPARLQRAAEQSLHKARAIARRVGSAKSQALPDAQADVVPVYSSDSGEYLVDLALGSPPQSFNGVLDTGSDLVWRQASSCSQCFQEPDPLFDPFKSSSYEILPCGDALCNALPAPICNASANSACTYQYIYGDGSATLGILSADTLTIAGSSVDTFVFGAGYFNFGSFGSVGMDGIVGMGGGPLSLVSQMSSSIENKFSYCFVPWNDAPSKTSPLFLGSAATLTGASVVSTPFLTSSLIPTFYYLDLQGISFNGKLLSIPPGTFDFTPDGSQGVIIDSGTTFTILVDVAYSPIRDSYSSAINLPLVNGSAIGLDLCYNNSENVKVDIPPLTFHFKGADVELPPENIFINFEGYLCLAFMSLPPGVENTINIYGNFQQQNFQLLYDKGSANQLSFKPINCETL